MAKLYLEEIGEEYEISEEMISKYSIKSGMVSPFTRTKVISTKEENKKIKS